MKRNTALFAMVLGGFLMAGCNQTNQLTQELVVLDASWQDNAVEHRGNNGIRYGYVCPPNPSKTNVGSVWGTDTYSDDSSICAAAVHAGAISFSGGTVTIEIRPGLSAYSGSTRNGVTTHDWGQWTGSFIVH